MMKTSPHRSVANNLVRLRRLRDIGLIDLASASGIAIGALSRLESGMGNPRLDTLSAIAQALDMPIEELFRRLEPDVHVVRGHETERRHRFGLTTFTSGHITAGGMDLELSFMRVGRPEPSMSEDGAVEHVMIVAGEVELELEDEKITLHQGDYFRLDTGAYHRYRAVGALARAILLTERRG